ncbi:MAG: hypothetical protein PUP92_39355, partial [Rhizonema sp. PD38]|nr:hypothetical protein [Rhizonema sp. PD38]
KRTSPLTITTTPDLLSRYIFIYYRWYKNGDCFAVVRESDRLSNCESNAVSLSQNRNFINRGVG